MKRICFVGGGNGTHVGAPLLSYKGHKVNILTRNPDKWQTNMSLKFPNNNIINTKINNISSNKKILHNSDIIFISSPVFAYEEIFLNINKYIKNNTIICPLFSQGHVNLMMKKYIEQYKQRNITLATLQYIPWQAKTIEYGKSGHLVGEKKELLLSIESNNSKESIKNDIEKIFNIETHIQPFIANCLTTSNQILHPVRYYNVFKNKTSKSIINKYHIPSLYMDMDYKSSIYLKNVSDEIMDIKQSLNNKYNLNLEHVLPLEERIKKQYGNQIGDYANIETIFKTASMYRKSKFAMINISPTLRKINTEHRHFIDDIPYGLIVLKNISNELDIKTPYIDELIYWNQKLMNKEYLINNKLSGKNINETGIYNNYGFSFNEIIE